jgi:hypothetical protein
MNLNFLAGVNANESTWKFESVGKKTHRRRNYFCSLMIIISGRMFFNITKSEPGIWRRLLKDTEKLSTPQMQIWWEMKEYFPKDMEAFSRLLENEENLKDKVSHLQNRLLEFLMKTRKLKRRRKGNKKSERRKKKLRL